MSNNEDFFPSSFTPEAREGAAFNTIKKDTILGEKEFHILFGGRAGENYFYDTWELSLDPFGWSLIVENQNDVPNVMGSFIQQIKTTNDRILLVGGQSETGESDNPTFQRNLGTENWDKRTFEDKIESFDQTPDTVDWVGLAKVKDNKELASDRLAAILLAWDSGFDQPFKYYLPNTNQWRVVPRRDRSKITQAYGSYTWTEWPEVNEKCRVYMLGGHDKNGNLLKLFQRVDLAFDSNQPPPVPVSIEMLHYSNHSILADEDSDLFTIDGNTPLFEGDPIVADGVGNIRKGNRSESRINVPVNSITASTCQSVFPLSAGVWDDELGWLDRSQLETHIIIPFSSVAQIRLIELYIIRSSGEIKVRIPLEDFGPHPILPQIRTDFSISPWGVDAFNRASGLLIFGGSINDVPQNDLWKISIEDSGTINQRFIWSRLN